MRTSVTSSSRGIGKTKPRAPGALKVKIWVSDDFDEPMMFLWDMIGSKK